MGADTDGLDDRKPQHRVYLDAYYIGHYPVTEAQYTTFSLECGRLDAHARPMVPGAQISSSLDDGAPVARFTRRLVELIESGYGLDAD